MSDAGGEGIAVAAAAPPRWVLALERAQALAHAAARIVAGAPASGADLGPAARPIEDAVASIFAALDRREDGLAATRAAQADLHVAALVLRSVEVVDPSFGEAVGQLEEARAALDVAIERFSRVPPETPPDPEDLRASAEVPRLHRIARDPITPRITPPLPLPPPAEPPPPPQRPATPADLGGAIAEVKRRTAERRRERAEREAEQARARAAAKAAEADPGDPPPGFARGAFAAKTRADFIAERTRECFEEVALIGMARAPLLGDPWRSARVLEDRLLAAVDAIAALGGPALLQIEPLAIDAPAKDPARGFAAVMILGCFEGRDALGAVERVIRHLDPADPDVARHVGGALALAPHPLLPQLLRALLADPDPAVRALAIHVLAYRGLAAPAELERAASDPSPLVVAAALPALSLARAPALADVLAPHVAHADAAVREAAWIALSLGGAARAPEVIAKELDGPLAARAAPALAIVGDDRDAAILLDRLRAAPSSALVNAVGWAGAPEAVPALLDLLDHDDPVVQLGAAYALDRITGAGLTAEVEVPPEIIAVPDVEDPDVDEPAGSALAKKVSDPRDLPSEGAPETISRPTTEAARWRAYWKAHAADYKPGQRYRRGQLHAAYVSCWELDTLALTPGERRLIQRELCVRTGDHVRFDPHDFVAVQEEAIAEWAKVARRRGGSAGAWTRPIHR